MKVIVIGAGNVATHLGKALKLAGHRIMQVYSRSESSAKTLGKKLGCIYTTDVKSILPGADIYIVSLHDAAIQATLRTLEASDKIIVHTSGSVPITVFQKKFKNYGVLYPVQTFSIQRDIQFKDIPLCLEANNEATKSKITRLARSISTKTCFVTSARRKKIHLAAVYANNFSNHMSAIAEHILKEDHISFDILRPLILETALKVQQHSPLEMQTGPARRGDSNVMKEHLKMLSGQ